MDSHHTGTLPHIPCRWRHCGRVCLHSGPLGFRNSFQCSQQDIYNSGYSQCWHNDHRGGIVHLSGSLIGKIWEKIVLLLLFYYFNYSVTTQITDHKFKCHHKNTSLASSCFTGDPMDVTVTSRPAVSAFTDEGSILLPTASSILAGRWASAPVDWSLGRQEADEKIGSICLI